MKLHAKYRIDAIAGRPLVWILNLLARPLGKLLRRDHGLTGTRRILVGKLMGLGSLVQITPLLAALRAGFPGAKLIFLTRQPNLAFCDRIDAIDETIAIDDSGIWPLCRSLVRAIVRMWKLRLDLYINLEIYSNLGALLAITSCARNRLGYFQTPRDQRAWGVYTHLVYFNQGAPIHEVYLQAARSLGLEIHERTLLEPRIAAEDLQSLERKLAALGVPEPIPPYIVVNPNSSELCKERRWPAEHFAKAIGAISELHPGWDCYLTGGPGEKGAEEVLALIPPDHRTRVKDLTGLLSLGEFMVLLRGTKTFLTNDSGPMHLAFSFRAPTVALFGPVHPDHYGGAEDPSRVMLYHRVYCSPCVHHFLEAPCRGDNQCMKLIQPEAVVAAIEGLLEGRPARGRGPGLQYLHPGAVFGAHQRQVPRAEL